MARLEAAKKSKGCDLNLGQLFEAEYSEDKKSGNGVQLVFTPSEKATDAKAPNNLANKVTSSDGFTKYRSAEAHPESVDMLI